MIFDADTDDDSIVDLSASATVSLEKQAEEAEINKSRKRGIAHEHSVMFKKHKDNKGKEYEERKCLYCSKTYSFKDATTSMLNHLKKDHKNKLANENVSGPMEMYLMAGTVPTIFSQKTFLDVLVKLVVVRDLPFNCVDWPELRQMVSLLRPGTTMIGRTTLKAEISRLFKIEKENLMKFFGSVTSNFSLTCDAWTSKNQSPFLGITAHWIDEDWCLQKQLIGFEYLVGEHSGENLAQSLYNCLVDFKINEKFLAITTNNASNNNTLMAEIERITATSSVSFRSEWSHIRCMVHVINLIVKEILTNLKKSTKQGLNGSDEFRTQPFSATIALEKEASMIRKIRKSPMQIQRFKATALSKGLEPLVPIIDVDTRWNSTYDMLERAYAYREVHNTHSFENKWHDLILSESDWNLILNVINIFKKATLTVSGSSYTTLNNSVFIFEFLLDAIKNFIEKHKCEISIKMALKAGEEKLLKFYDKTSLVGKLATVLDPRKKIRFYENIGRTQEWIEDLKEHFYDAYRLYDSTHKVNLNKSNENKVLQESDEMSSFLTKVSQDDELPVSSEIQKYYRSATCAQSISPLDWRKVNQNEYPVLALMAKDYLAVQASSVACEELFSLGVDLVTAERSRLSATSITETMCLKYWTKNKM